MATKNNPGVYDCYAKADPDEPMFILLGRDKHAAEVVRYWIYLKSGGLPLGYCSAINMAVLTDLPNKQREAYNVSVELEEWAKLKPNEAPGL